MGHPPLRLPGSYPNAPNFQPWITRLDQPVTCSASLAMTPTTEVRHGQSRGLPVSRGHAVRPLGKRWGRRRTWQAGKSPVRPDPQAAPVQRQLSRRCLDNWEWNVGTSN